MSSTDHRIARRHRLAQAAAHEARKRSAKAPRRPRADDSHELELELRQARLVYGARS